MILYRTPTVVSSWTMVLFASRTFDYTRWLMEKRHRKRSDYPESKDFCLHRYTVKDGLPSDLIRVIGEDREGSLWRWVALRKRRQPYPLRQLDDTKLVLIFETRPANGLSRLPSSGQKRSSGSSSCLSPSGDAPWILRKRSLSISRVVGKVAVTVATQAITLLEVVKNDALTRRLPDEQLRFGRTRHQRPTNEGPLPD